VIFKFPFIIIFSIKSRTGSDNPGPFIEKAKTNFAASAGLTLFIMLWPDISTLII